MRAKDGGLMPFWGSHVTMMKREGSILRTRGRVGLCSWGYPIYPGPGGVGVGNISNWCLKTPGNCYWYSKIKTIFAFPR